MKLLSNRKCFAILIFSVCSLFCTVLYTVPSYASSKPSAVKKNNAGVENLQNEEYHKAYQNFVAGLAEEPFNPAIRLNLGLSFEANEEADKAIKEYDAAIRTSGGHREILFLAYYNAARVKASQSNIAGALAYYQKALDLKPESKEVKINIELLWQQGQGKGKGKKDDSKKDGKGSGDDQQQKDDKGDKEKEDNKDGQGKDKQQDQQKQSENEKKKKQPKPFDSKELTKNDVRKILEELKNQEQSIRAKVYGKGVKEQPRGKDW